MTQNTTFLGTALKYNISEYSEDRLSQIVAASFNVSPIFRRIFLDFLKVKADSKNLHMYTQLQSATSRPDMLIRDGKKSLILIESKVDLDVSQTQLDNHKKYNDTFNHYRVIAKYNAPVKGLWKLHTWYELNVAVESQFKRKNSQLDAFILKEVSGYLKELKLNLAQTIKKNELKEVAKFITNLRFEQEIDFNFKNSDPFKTLTDAKDILKQIVEELKVSSKTSRYFKDRYPSIRMDGFRDFTNNEYKVLKSGKDKYKLHQANSPALGIFIDFKNKSKLYIALNIEGTTPSKAKAYPFICLADKNWDFFQDFQSTPKDFSVVSITTEVEKLLMKAKAKKII